MVRAAASGLSRRNPRRSSFLPPWAVTGRPSRPSWALGGCCAALGTFVSPGPWQLVQHGRQRGEHPGYSVSSKLCRDREDKQEDPDGAGDAIKLG